MQNSFVLVVAAVFAAVGHVSAHMEVTWPPPLRSKHNPFAGNDIDYSMTSPLKGSGSDFPCKGSLSLLGTDQASPVTTYQAGGTYNVTISGGANHNGGSCQVSLSVDSGKTFKVLHSYIGNCPTAGTSSLDFTVPADVPQSDEAILSWSWLNKVGNREFYMNCAVVSLVGTVSARSPSPNRHTGIPRAKRAASFSSLPEMFIANIENGCKTLDGTDVLFPDPGADVSGDPSTAIAPDGTCGAAAANPDDGTGSGPGSGSPSSSVPAAPEPSSPASEAPPSSSAIPAPSTAVAAPSSSLPGGVFVTVSVPGSSPTQPAGTEPTTLATVTKTGVAASPTTTASPSNGPGSGSGGGSSGSVAPGTACTSEGQWNCIGGTQFQRCASGAWSQLISMAAGTSCQPGMGDTLVMSKKRSGARRFLSAWTM